MVNGDFTATQSGHRAAGGGIHRHHQRGGAAGLHRHRVTRAAGLGLQDDFVIARREIGDRERRHPTLGHRRRAPSRLPGPTEPRAGPWPAPRRTRGTATPPPPRSRSAGSRGGRPRRAARGCAAPDASVTRAGVRPRSTPSTNTGTPSGFDCTTSVPIAGAAAAPPYILNATMPPPISTTAAIAAAIRIQGRAGGALLALTGSRAGAENGWSGSKSARAGAGGSTGGRSRMSSNSVRSSGSGAVRTLSTTGGAPSLYRPLRARPTAGAAIGGAAATAGAGSRSDVT